MIVTIIGWVSALTVLATYFNASRTGWLRPFHIANVVCGITLGLINAAAGLWFNVALNVVYGGVALWALLRKEKKVEPTIEELYEHCRLALWTYAAHLDNCAGQVDESGNCACRIREVFAAHPWPGPVF